ncbi:CU044_5270 family protein [Nonomuraea sp. NPDC002799]
MNPMDELRAARPAHLGDRPVDERTRAVEMSRAMAGPRRGERRKRRTVVRPAWSLGLLGAAAAVTAAVIVVTGGTGGTPTPPLASDGGSLAVRTTAAPKVRLSARDVLLAAAEKADRQEEKSGGYWHTVSVSRMLFTAAKGGYQVLNQQREEGWTPSATGGDQWSRSRTLGARPATEADRQAWEAAGSPAKISVVVPGKKGTIELSTSPGRAQTGHAPLVDGDKVFWLGRNVSMKDLRDLPGEPGELKQWLLKSYEGHGTEGDSEQMSADTWLFKVSAGLITDMPVTPQVRGAAFRMLAELDTVKAAEGVTDAEGRQGAAVSVEETVRGGTVLENRLIIDEGTGQALANENIVVKGAGPQAGLEPGAVYSSSAVIEAGWTDTKP